MRRLLATSLLATALLGAMPAGPAIAIVGGVTDLSSHQGVGALLGPTGMPTCSGALVTSRTRGEVFLTAAHCLGWAGNRRWVRISFGATVRSGPVISGVYHVMPGYNPSTHVDDIAVVTFTSPPRIGAFSLGGAKTRPAQGATVTTVGYGLPSIGVRKWATEIVTGSTSSWLYLRRGSGNSCHGDSGGPDLVTPSNSNTPVILAVTTQGTCHSNQDFIVTGAAVHNFVNNPR